VPQEGAVWADQATPGTVFHELARRKECKIEEGHLMPHHVHILISIRPKYSVAEVIGYLKVKSSIWVAQNVERRLRNFLGRKFWARGYFVSTVGRDEEMIRAYIKNQEMADKQLDHAVEARILIKAPISCHRIFHNRLWRFPFKPPALLGFIGSKPPPLGGGVFTPFPRFPPIGGFRTLAAGACDTVGARPASENPHKCSLFQSDGESGYLSLRSGGAMCGDPVASGSMGAVSVIGMS
jgi:putative transposase